MTNPKQHQPGFCDDKSCCGDAETAYLHLIGPEIVWEVRRDVFFRLAQAATEEDLVAEFDRLINRFLALERGEHPNWVMSVGGMLVSYEPESRTFTHHEKGVALFQEPESMWEKMMRCEDV